MKKLFLSVLIGSAVIDILSDAHSTRLVDALSARPPSRSFLSVLLASPVATKIEHWSIFFLAFVALSVLMRARKPTGPKFN